MTENFGDDPTPGSRAANGHVGDLKLRRLFGGEDLGADHDKLTAHAASCLDCARRLATLADEQRAFEDRISFDRFAAGVKRAARVPAAPVGARAGWGRPASTRSFFTIMSVGSVAAALALVVGVRPVFENARARRAEAVENERTRALNRTKGGAGGRAAVAIRVAGVDGAGQQRSAATDSPERLTVGERIRVGVQPGGHGFLFAISIDDQGVVTPLYPERGSSLSLSRGAPMQYLPDSLELTGKGIERLVVLLTDQPLELQAVRRAAAAALTEVGGDVRKLPNLPVGGEQFHRLFVKP